MKNSVDIAYSLFGGFYLSNSAYEYLKKWYNLTEEEVNNLERHDIRLIKCLNSIGRVAAEVGTKIAIYSLKDAEKYAIIKNDDGSETIITLNDFDWINVN